MILKASQRGGPRQLAVHLMKIGKSSDKDNEADNDHVTVADLRGFVADDIYGAMAETLAIARGTKCEKCVFSLSMNPPKDAEVSTETFIGYADRIEEALGLKNQPRAIVIHEKNGRRHAHVVFSRIDAEKMKAIELPFFKLRLKDLSKEFYLENGWELPEGHKTDGWKNPLNFTLAEFQQAKRQGLDPREIKQIFQTAWSRSDNLDSFRNALEESGYYLAKGDRRGIVAVDLLGEVYSAARWTGVKTKDFERKAGKGDGLPGVAQVKGTIESEKRAKVRKMIFEHRNVQTAELKPLLDEAQRMAKSQRAERTLLAKKQSERLTGENKTRAARFSRGLGAVLDLLTGRLFKQRRENEREAFLGFVRDRSQREQLFSAQLKEREAIQVRIDVMKSQQANERTELAQKIAFSLQATSKYQDEFEQQQMHRLPGQDLDL